MSESIVAKIKKLLKLAQSQNPHEAALAAARAAELMAEHKIDAADVEASGGAERTRENVDEIELDAGHRKRIPWKGYLGDAVSRAFDCLTFWRDSTLCLVGRISEHQAATYTYQYLVAEIERLGAAGRRDWGPGWFNSFALGAVEELDRRLMEAKAARELRAQRAGKSAALVLVRKDAAEVGEFLAKLIPDQLLMEHDQSPEDEARGQGRYAGRQIPLEGKAALKSGDRAIEE